MQITDEMVEKAAYAYWEQYREEWRPLGVLSMDLDKPFFELPLSWRSPAIKAMRAALDAVTADETESGASADDDGAAFEPKAAATQPERTP